MAGAFNPMGIGKPSLLGEMLKRSPHLSAGVKFPRLPTHPRFIGGYNRLVENDRHQSFLPPIPGARVRNQF